MSLSKTRSAVLLLILTFCFSTGVLAQNLHEHENSLKSPYAGQETLAIKALSENDIQGLLNGAGTPFGGMAKTAELNGYPGPRHVLDAYEAGSFSLTDEQQTSIRALFEEMKEQAIELGTDIISIEKKIELAFNDKTMTQNMLEESVAQSARIYGQLRALHLGYHLQMIDILTPAQIQEYNILRGYNLKIDPCENIPEGHNPEMWKMHNNCGD